MSEREELEAEIAAIELAWLLSESAIDTAGLRRHLATALLSSGYTKGNGELVEAVRELIDAADTFASMRVCWPAEMRAAGEPISSMKEIAINYSSVFEIGAAIEAVRKALSALPNDEPNVDVNRLIDATPKPDPSPVCVEVKGLEWTGGTQESPDACVSWSAESPFGEYQIIHWLDGTYRRTIGGEPFGTAGTGTLEAAQAACDADHERRTLQLVNARSVESVKAEARAEYEAELREASTTWHKAAASLTEGEG